MLEETRTASPAIGQPQRCPPGRERKSSAAGRRWRIRNVGDAEAIGPEPQVGTLGEVRAPSSCLARLLKPMMRPLPSTAVI